MASKSIPSDQDFDGIGVQGGHVRYVRILLVLLLRIIEGVN